MKYEFLLFDADGTLFDFLKCEEMALRDAMKNIGITIDDEGVALYSKINDGLWKALERGEIDKESLRVERFRKFGEEYGFETDFNKLSLDYTDRLALQNFPIDGAIDVCRRLYGRVKMYIITNGIEYVQKSRFATSPLNEFFEKLFISGEIGFEKPDKRFFEAVEQGIPNFDPQKALVIGDSLTSDMKGGIGYGIDCCWYNPSNKTTDLPVKYTISDLAEIEEIIFGE